MQECDTNIVAVFFLNLVESWIYTLTEGALEVTDFNNGYPSVGLTELSGVSSNGH